MVGWRGETSTARGGSEPLHQLVVLGAREHEGRYSFDVYDPTRGDTRTLTGEQLLRYSDGVNVDPQGRPIEGALRFVQVPEDLPMRPWAPAPPPVRSRAEAAARELIVTQEPHKLAALHGIDRLDDAGLRHQLTMLLRGERNLDRLAYLEDAVRGGKDTARHAVRQLSDPQFAPDGRTAADPALVRLRGASTPAQFDAALAADFSSYRGLDAQSRSAVADLFAANDAPASRRALIELLPTLAELPQTAREQAIDRLNGMMPGDLVRTAERHRNLEPPSWRLAPAEDVTRYVKQVFGGAPIAPVAQSAPAGSGSWSNQRVSYLHDEAFIYSGREIRIVDTLEGPQAFYRRTGLGGQSPFGAQRGDWVPFEGFAAGQLVKTRSARDFDPSIPLTLHRWGSEEAKQIGEWIAANDVPRKVHVGEEWARVQKVLERAGVKVAFRLFTDEQH